MDALTAPLVRLVQELQWFVVAKDVRVLSVVVSAELRGPALEHIAAQEHDPANFHPFVFLETAVEGPARGWDARSDELREDFEELRGLLAGLAPPIELLPLPDANPRHVGVARFAVELKAALSALVTPLQGLVIVVAPVAMTALAQFIDETEALVRNPALAAARWILVGAEVERVTELATKLGPAGKSVNVTIDRDAARSDFAASLAFSPGVIGPKEAPPPRPNKSPPLTTEERQRLAGEAGVPPALLDPAVGLELRGLVGQSAVAASEGRHTDAIRNQRQAIALSRTHGLSRQAASLELMLGSLIIQAGQPQQAIPVYRSVETEAAAAGHHDVVVQALMGRAAAQLLLGQKESAAVDYAEAGRVGELSGATVLAIEGYRLSGELLLGFGQEAEAVRVWTKGLAAAGKLPPDVRAMTSAAETARALAGACRSRGLEAQAEALERQALALESGSATATSTPPAGQ